MNKEDNLWKRVIAARLEADELCRPYPAIIGTQTGLYRGADCLAASKKAVQLLREYQKALETNDKQN